ncbi:MAG: hypothetical protein R3245_08035, partial [Kiloniellales bacterium]|nr:hypothetical protein [Kiloniellales bacterium]
TKSGYSPEAMADFLSQLQAHTRLEAAISGNPEAAERFSILQTHPRTADRIRDAQSNANLIPVEDPVFNRSAYLKQIDGLLYGDNPDHGVVEGRRFIHPKLGFTFEVPLGYQLFAGQRRVAAQGPEGAIMLFAAAPENYSGPMTSYVQDVWAQQNVLELERLTINGFEAASGWVAAGRGSNARYFHASAVRYKDGRIYRFLASIPARLAERFEGDFDRIAGSFRQLEPGEARTIKSRRLALHKVGRGESAREIADRMPFEGYRLERLMVLNGLESAESLRAGDTLKTVVEE